MAGGDITLPGIQGNMSTLPISMGGCGLRTWGEHDGESARLQCVASLRTSLDQNEGLLPFSRFIWPTRRNTARVHGANAGDR